MSSAHYITVHQRGDSYIVDMLQQDILLPKTEMFIDKKLISDICHEIQRITLDTNNMLYAGGSISDSERVLDSLRNTGSILFNHLMPREVQKSLKSSQGSDLVLRLDEKLLPIPWELCFDGENFISLRFRIGRQVLTERRINVCEQGGINEDRQTMLIIIDPSETLKNAQMEADLLLSALEGQTDFKVEIVGGRHANKMQIIQEMKGKGIVHFIGHSYYDERHPEKSGWLLKDGILTSEDISRIDNPPIVVFSNSCQSAAAASFEGYLFDEKSFGIGGGFMIAGVKNFIGPLWVIHDEESARFAGNFYRAFVIGATIGEALQEAKRYILNNGGAHNILWASYMLYGDPAYRLSPSPMTDNAAPENNSLPQYVYSHSAGSNFSAEKAEEMQLLMTSQGKSNFVRNIAIAIILICISAISGLYMFTDVFGNIKNFLSIGSDADRIGSVAVADFANNVSGFQSPYRIDRIARNLLAVHLSRAGYFKVKEKDGIASDSNTWKQFGTKYVVVGSIIDIGSESKFFSGYGVNTNNLTYKVAVEIRVIDASNGEIVFSDTASDSKTVRQTDNLIVQDEEGIYKNLLNNALATCAQRFEGYMKVKFQKKTY